MRPPTAVGGGVLGSLRGCGGGPEGPSCIAGSSALYSLEAPIQRLCGLDAPMPYAPALEAAMVPQLDDIVGAARALATREG